MRCDNLIGRLLLLDPLLEGSDHIEHVGAFTTSAMPHTRRHEQAVCIADRRSQRLLHPLVVLDAVARGDLRIVPSVVLNQLATTIDERLQVHIHRVDQPGVCRVSSPQVRLGVETIDLPGWILGDDEAELVESVALADAVHPRFVHPSSLPR